MCDLTLNFIELIPAVNYSKIIFLKKNRKYKKKRAAREWPEVTFWSKPFNNNHNRHESFVRYETAHVGTQPRADPFLFRRKIVKCLKNVDAIQISFEKNLRVKILKMASLNVAHYAFYELLHYSNIYFGLWIHALWLKVPDASEK